jgi:hypothetical protein
MQKLCANHKEKLKENTPQNNDLGFSSVHLHSSFKI